MIMQALLWFADHLIEIMGTGLVAALALRYYAFRSGQQDLMYFKTFARGVEKILESDSEHRKVEDVESWLGNTLNEVLKHLPERSLRFSGGTGRVSGSVASPMGFRNRESITQYAEGKRSVVHAVRSQLDSFKSPHRPDFQDITDRVLGMDTHWTTLLGLPFSMVSRILDVLPGLFVVGGIFGTFVAIAHALPMVGKIDIAKIAESAPVLTAFIDAVAVSMRCSITGILCSMVMTLLNALFPLTASRETVQVELERAMESIWNRIHGNELSYADRRTLELLETIASLMLKQTETAETRRKSA